MGFLRMSYAPADFRGIDGSFTNAETNLPFDFVSVPVKEQIVVDINGKLQLAQHKVFVGPNGCETRFAVIKKTVAYVVVDETDFGWVVERWQIRNTRFFY